MVLNLKPIRISLFARSFVAVAVAVVGYGDGDGAVECWLPVCRLDGLPGCQAAELPAPATLAATAMASTVTQTATGGRSQLNNGSHNNSNSNNNSHNDSAPPIPITYPTLTRFPCGEMPASILGVALARSPSSSSSSSRPVLWGN